MKFFEDFAEPFEVEIVHAVLDVQQHRHAEFLRHLGHALDVGGIAIDAELLFADPAGAAPQILSDFRRRFGQVGHFVRKEKEFLGMRRGQVEHGFVAVAFGSETVRLAIVCRGPVHDRAGRQQDGQRHAHGLLMADEVVIRTAVVMSVLMDVDDRLCRCRVGLRGGQAGREQKRGGHAEEFAAGQTWLELRAHGSLIV